MGIEHYSKPNKDGGVTVDVEAIALDLVMICKAGRRTREEVLQMVGQIYDEAKVTVRRPTDN